MSEDNTNKDELLGTTYEKAPVVPPSEVELQDWEEYVRHTWGTRSFMAAMHQRLIAEIRRQRMEVGQLRRRVEDLEGTKRY